jgi:hypothetical protein
MATGTFSYISIDQVVAETLLELQLLNGTAERSLIKRFIKQVIDGLYTNDMIISKEATLTSDNNIFELPDDFISMTHPRSVAIIDGTQGTSGTYPLVSNNPFFSGPPSGGGDLIYTSYMQVVGNKIYLNDGIDASSIKIAYNAVNTDQNGSPLIPASYERCLVAYSKWKYAQSFSREFDANLRMEFRAEYLTEKRTLRGRANLLSDSDRQILTNIMNRIVQ